MMTGIIGLSMRPEVHTPSIPKQQKRSFIYDDSSFISDDWSLCFALLCLLWLRETEFTSDPRHFVPSAFFWLILRPSALLIRKVCQAMRSLSFAKQSKGEAYPKRKASRTKYLLRSFVRPLFVKPTSARVFLGVLCFMANAARAYSLRPWFALLSKWAFGPKGCRIQGPRLPTKSIPAQQLLMLINHVRWLIATSTKIWCNQEKRDSNP